MYILYWDYEAIGTSILLFDLEAPAIAGWTSSINLAINGLRHIKTPASLLYYVQIADDLPRVAKFKFETLKDL